MPSNESAAALTLVGVGPGDPDLLTVAAVRALAAAAVVAYPVARPEAVGMAASLVTQTIDYLNTRVQFGVALSTFQALRHRLVEMYVAYENSYGLIRHLVTAHSAAPQPLADILTARPSWCSARLRPCWPRPATTAATTGAAAPTWTWAA